MGRMQVYYGRGAGEHGGGVGVARGECRCGMGGAGVAREECRCDTGGAGESGGGGAGVVPILALKEIP